MYNTALAKGPVFDGTYVPYFYQSGKFLSYDIPHRGPKSPYFGTSTGYDFASDIVPNISRTRGPTVEDIINNGYFPIPKSEPETAIISDKKQTSGLGLGGIINQVRQRYEIYERNIYQIELGKCYTICDCQGKMGPCDTLHIFLENKHLHPQFSRWNFSRFMVQLHP